MALEAPPAASTRLAKAMDDAESGSGSAGGRPARQRSRTGGGNDAEAFDIWLQQGLHRLYDSVAKEPIPDELLKLIEQDRTDRTK